MPPQLTLISNKILQFKIIILWLIVFILTIYFLYFVVKNATRPSHGFASYYTASRLLLEGENINNYYNDDWFSSRVNDFVPGVYEIYNVNMPTASLILLPFASFDYASARLGWTIFNLIIFIITIVYIIRKIKFQSIWTPLIIILFLCYQPMYSNFAQGQVYFLIFCSLVLAWFAFESRKEELLGLLLGLIFILKTTSVILLILLLIQKEWRSLIWAFATALFIVILSLPWLSFNSWLAYTNKLIEYTSLPALSVTAYQTIHSISHHFTTYDQQWNPEPLLKLPILGNLLSVIFSLSLIIVTSMNTLKFKKMNLSFGAFIIAGIVISPASLDYHYVLLLIPIIILLDWLRKNSNKLLWFTLFLFYLMICLPLPYSSLRVTGGVWAILAYPKLYGAIGLWYVSLLVSRRSVPTDDRLKKN